VFATSRIAKAIALGLAGLLLSTGTVQATEIKVMSSGGFAAAYRALAGDFRA